jgi:hypothetical protein
MMHYSIDTTVIPGRHSYVIFWLDYLHQEILTAGHRGSSDHRAMPVETDDAVGNGVRTLLSRATKFSHIVDFSHFSLDCLETYCRQELSAREKLSPFIEDILNTLPVCVKCLYQLWIYSCYAKLKLHLDSARFSPAYARWYIIFTRSFELVLNTRCDGNSRGLQEQMMTCCLLGTDHQRQGHVTSLVYLFLRSPS